MGKGCPFLKHDPTKRDLQTQAICYVGICRFGRTSFYRYKLVESLFLYFMPRETVILECTEARKEGKPPSRYMASRNKKPDRTGGEKEI